MVLSKSASKSAKRKAERRADALATLHRAIKHIEREYETASIARACALVDAHGILVRAFRRVLAEQNAALKAS